jgi:prepilin peptidase CpaA
MSLPLPYLGALGLGLAWAVVSDLRRRRIPNVVAASVFVLGLGVRGYEGGFRALSSGLVAAVLLFVLLYGVWRAGAIGGGDVKLAAATGAWVGLAELPWFVLATLLAGGVVAAFCYLLARAPARAEVRANVILTVLHGELPPAASHRRGHPSIPYAVAIAAGAAVALVVV